MSNISTPNTGDAMASISAERVDADTNSEPNFILKFFITILSFFRRGIFENPPFSLEIYFPGIAIFKNKYFKTAAISLIYLALIISLLVIFKPGNNRKMFYIYVICFWITVLILSFWITNPYDENSVEYMLRGKIIKEAKNLITPSDDEKQPSVPELPGNNPSATELYDEKQPSAPELPGNNSSATELPGNNSVVPALDEYNLAMQTPDGKPLFKGPNDTFLIKSDTGGMIVVNKDGSPILNREGKQILFGKNNKFFTENGKPLDSEALNKYKTTDGIENGIMNLKNKSLSSDDKKSSDKSANNSQYPDTFQGRSQKDIVSKLTQ